MVTPAGPEQKAAPHPLLPVALRITRCLAGSGLVGFPSTSSALLPGSTSRYSSSQATAPSRCDRTETRRRPSEIHPQARTAPYPSPGGRYVPATPHSTVRPGNEGPCPAAGTGGPFPAAVTGGVHFETPASGEMALITRGNPCRAPRPPGQNPFSPY